MLLGLYLQLDNALRKRGDLTRLSGECGVAAEFEGVILPQSLGAQRQDSVYAIRTGDSRGRGCDKRYGNL